MGPALGMLLSLLKIVKSLVLALLFSRPLRRLVPLLKKWQPLRVLLSKEELQRASIDFNAPSFIRSASDGLLKNVDLFIQAGIDVNLSGDGGDTALISATRQRQEHVVRRLLKEDSIDVDARNQEGESAWIAAIRSRATPIEELLKARGADDRDVEKWRLRVDLEDRGLFDQEAFVDCCARGRTSEVRELLAAGMDVNTRDRWAEPALLVAALRGQSAVVGLLLEQKAVKVNAQADRDGDSPLIVASREGKIDVVERLLQHPEIDVNARNRAGESALLEAARRGFKGIVEELEGSDAEEPDLERRIARWQLEQDEDWNASGFIDAAGRGDAGKIERYLLAGMDVNTTDEHETALMAAAWRNQIEVVRLLKNQAGIDLDALNRERDRVSAAEIAAYKGYDEIADVLVKAGAKLDFATVARRRLGEAGLPYAPDRFVSMAAKGQETQVRLFLEAGMHANGEDEDGRMALSAAAGAGQTAIVKLLLDKGADPNLRDHHLGLSAREVARREGFTEVAKVLEEAGAASPERPKNRLVAAVEQGDLAEVQKTLADGTSIDAYTESGRPVLMEAVLGRRPDIVNELLEKGAAADATDRDGMTCLMRATEMGHVETMRLLLDDERASVDAVDPEGRTALLLAASQGRIAAVKLLLDAGADPRLPDRRGRTALMAAETNEHAEIVELLRERGGAGDLRPAELLTLAARGDHVRLAELVDGAPAVDLEVSDEAGNTPLALAAARGWTRSMEVLLKAGARPDAANDDGDTPLMQAAQAGRRGAVKLLLRDKGAARSLAAATNAGGETALLQAAEAGRGPIAELLAAYTPEPDLGAEGRTPLIELSHYGDVEAVTALLDAGADPNQQQVLYGKSPLMTATLAGRTEVVAKLRERGARAGEAEAQLFLNAKSGEVDELHEMHLDGVDLDARDHRGWTALMLAADEGHDGVVEFLLGAGARDIPEPDSGKTALWLAASRGRRGALALLIEHAQPSESSRARALVEAAAGGHAEAVWLLVEQAGAAVDGLARGRVPLVEAARAGHLQVVKVLLELGADPERKTRKGMTALRAALRHGHDAVVDLLLESGSDAGLKEERLLMAAGKPDVDEVERLLRLPLPDQPHLDARDEAGRTALMVACAKGAHAVVEVLLRAYGEGAHLAVIDRDERDGTPLMWAASAGSGEIVARLLGLGADVAAESKDRRTALMEACKAGRFDAVELLLKAMEDDAVRRVAVNQKDDQGNTPLGEALAADATARQREYEKIVSLLERYGAEVGREQAEFLKAARLGDLATVKDHIGAIDLHTLRYHGKTPLMLAAESGHRDVAEYLLEKGVDVDETGPYGVTALILSARDQGSLVELLLEHHADCDRTDNSGSSALLEAVNRGDKDIVEELIAAGANVNQRNRAGATALILAVGRDDSQIVDRLLASDGVDLDAEVEHRTALTLARLRGHPNPLSADQHSTEDELPAPDQLVMPPLVMTLTKIETKLFVRGARKGWDEAQLILAARDGNSTWARQLLGKANVHVRDLDGNTPLLIACDRGDLSLASALLAEAASPGVRNHADRTPLMEAAKNSLPALVEELLERDPHLDLDAQDREGEAALLEAARAGADGVVTLLLERGANVRVANRNGETPLILTAGHGSTAILRALLAHGANACARTAHHRTAVTEAAAEGHRKNLEVLLEHLQTRLAGQRVNRETIINAVDDDSSTALDLAEGGGHDACVSLLSEHGGKRAKETEYVVWVTEHGGAYHRRGCANIKHSRLTDRLLLEALREHYEFCRVCRPGQAKIDWTC
jgi:ankyrin repeat protein